MRCRSRGLRSSARKHGIDDADLLHPFRMVFAAFEEDDGMTMFIGAARNGIDMLEVGVVNSEGMTLIVHAMEARDKYLRWI